MTTKVKLVTRTQGTHLVKNGVVNFNGISATFLPLEEEAKITSIPIAEVDYITTEEVAGDSNQ